MSISEQPTDQDILNNVLVSGYHVIDLSTDDGKSTYAQVVSAYDVDLSNASNKCTFLYQLFPKQDPNNPDANSNLVILGIVQTTAEWAIALVQDGMNTILSQLYASTDASQIPQVPVNGIYNCDSAKYMVLIAQMARGTGVGQVDLWPLDQIDFSYCIARSDVVGDVIEYNVAQANPNMTNDQITAYFTQYFEPKIECPIPENSKFVGASVPSSCQGVVGGGTGTGTGTNIVPVSEKDEGKKTPSWVWPAVVGTVTGVALIGVGYMVFKEKEPETYPMLA